MHEAVTLCAITKAVPRYSSQSGYCEYAIDLGETTAKICSYSLTEKLRSLLDYEGAESSKFRRVEV